MNNLTPEQLAQRATDLGLVDRRQMESVWSELGSEVTMVGLQRVLLGRGCLTNYQFDRLARGEKAGFFYGDYKVLYLVGTGTFARVYRAVHRETGQIVAIKILRKRHSETPVQTDQFLREGTMGSKLRHPNIVPIYEVYSKKKIHFLVMEFVEGQNLRDFMKVRKRLPIPDAISIATDITAGLAYAAEQGITHRDLKLSNVLISSSGRAQLVDFGLAAVTAGEEDDDMSNPRTIDYAGLEKATGVRKDDHRSDIFFNGCMLYQLLSGIAPLFAGDRMQRMNNSRFSNIKPLQEVDPDVPKVIAKVVNKSIELDPNKRYQQQSEMLTDLRTVQALIKQGKLERADPDAMDTLRQARTVMFVESNPKMQDLFREHLKKDGYRALVMRSPALAMRRLEGERDVANAAVFSCIGLGQEGLEAFNHFAKASATRAMPAILLLGKGQQSWSQHAQVAEHRVVLTMPINIRQLRESLDKLLAD